jgi:hypothetical protein
MSNELEVMNGGQVEGRGKNEQRYAFLPILVAGIALLVHPSGLRAQAVASAQISAEVLVLPERALIEQGGSGETQRASVAVASQSGASVNASLLQGDFVRVAIRRDPDILQTRIDFIAN